MKAYSTASVQKSHQNVALYILVSLLWQYVPISASKIYSVKEYKLSPSAHEMWNATNSTLVVRFAKKSNTVELLYLYLNISLDE